MALVVAENRTIHCDYGSFILENLVEANLKGSTKNKLYMSAWPMLTRIAYLALGMIEDLPMANFQAALIQHARLVARPVRTTTTATSSRASRSSKKSSSDDERTDTDKEDSQKGFDDESPKGSQAMGPSELESDEEDTSIPLHRKGTKKSKKPRSAETQIAYAKAQARVEERKKKLADARAAKAAASAKCNLLISSSPQFMACPAARLQQLVKQTLRASCCFSSGDPAPTCRFSILIAALSDLTQTVDASMKQFWDRFTL
ncbi:hypothetical protein L7F22_005450 [Adiantum nelumboides]|nr:hypothetical protein [Adiantum nelumboides]